MRTTGRGLSYLSHKQWLIVINGADSRRRQRLTVFHEYKHILDHGRLATLYGNSHALSEAAADYFAGCVLVPEPLLRRCWNSGLRDTTSLARRFEASARAVAVRLYQTGLSSTIDTRDSGPITRLVLDLLAESPDTRPMEAIA